MFVNISLCTLSGQRGDIHLLLLDEEYTRTNIGISECMGRTTDALHVNWNTSPHDEGLNRYQSMISIAPSKTRTHAMIS